MHESYVVSSPVGPLRIKLEQGSLAAIELNANPPLSQPVTPSGKAVVEQLVDYFHSAGNAIKISILPQGTVFQRSVWQALGQIPPGETRTYSELAEQLGSSARAVGNACRRNPTPIVVPCHRVVAKDGLGGFAGQQSGKLMEIKRYLLAHEGMEF